MNQSTEPPVPPFIRIPRPGERCHHTKLSRSTLYALITPCAANNYNPPVKSHVVKSSRFAQRGTRLIDRESLLAYIKTGNGSPSTLNPSEKA